MKTVLTTSLLLSFGCAMAQQRMPQRNPALDSLVNEKDVAVRDQKIKQLYAGSENDLGLLMQYYRTDAGKGDSILKLAVARYPDGRYASTAAQNAIYSEKSAAKQEQLLTAYRNKFRSVNTDMPSYSVANAYAGEKNTAKALQYLDSVKAPSFHAQVVPIIAEGIMAYDNKAAASLVKKELAAAKTRMEQPAPAAETGGNQQMSPKSAYYSLAALYAKVLLASKNHKEALTYIQEAYDNTERKGDELTKSYAYLLSLNGKYAEAFPLMEKLVTAGKGDAALKKELRTAYTKVNPGKDAAAYISGIETALNEKMREEVAKKLISEASPSFSVKDINGKTVSLADFKGKTIVLDFWATWCGPCKKSFPVMQTAVNNYKNDPNVKFLFIHTWERGTDTPKEDAVSYLKDNKYSFDLYMDLKDEATKNNPAVSAFDVKGIPAKFVIDGEGNIRFKVTGFSPGADDAAVAELSNMIELAKIKS